MATWTGSTQGSARYQNPALKPKEPTPLPELRPKPTAPTDIQTAPARAVPPPPTWNGTATPTTPSIPGPMNYQTAQYQNPGGQQVAPMQGRNPNAMAAWQALLGRRTAQQQRPPTVHAPGFPTGQDPNQMAQAVRAPQGTAQQPMVNYAGGDPAPQYAGLSPEAQWARYDQDHARQVASGMEYGVFQPRVPRPGTSGQPNMGPPIVQGFDPYGGGRTQQPQGGVGLPPGERPGQGREQGMVPKRPVDTRQQNQNDQMAVLLRQAGLPYEGITVTPNGGGQQSGGNQATGSNASGSNSSNANGGNGAGGGGGPQGPPPPWVDSFTNHLPPPPPPPLTMNPNSPFVSHMPPPPPPPPTSGPAVSQQAQQAARQQAISSAPAYQYRPTDQNGRPVAAAPAAQPRGTEGMVQINGQWWARDSEAVRQLAPASYQNPAA